MTSAGDLDPLTEEIGTDTKDALSSAVAGSGGPVDHGTLKYSLLGPSLLKAGQDSVDQSKVSDIIYNASKGSKYFDREEERDKILSSKIDQLLVKKAQLERLDLSRDLRLVDTLIAQLESTRDLSQHIVHVDCDAFYAAVELLDRPELVDVPFAVGGGVLSTCNYVARKFGCRSGMAGFVAKKLCPQLILLKPDFTKYNAKAQEVRQILAEYDPRFESASIDEAYLNVTDYCAAHNTTPTEAVEELRRNITEKTKVTVSAGIAANTRLAKICSNMNKPNGQYVLQNDRAAIFGFMKELPCRKVNGVGRVFERELASVGIKTCGDIYRQRRFLSQLFGDKACQFLVHCYLGLGRTRVQPAEEYERKSVGTESTFADLSDPEKLRQKLRWTAEELEKDLQRAACKGRTLVLKIKLHTFEVYTRQVVTSRAIYLADDLYSHALPMLCKLEQEVTGMTIRLMGLRCTHLASTKPPDTLAFFGMKPPRSTDTQYNSTIAIKMERESVEGGLDDSADWGALPENVNDRQVLVDRNEANASDSGLQLQPQLAPRFQQWPTHPTEPHSRRHGKEITANPRTGGGNQPAPQGEWWHCPVCLRVQPADERQFNSHIDSCLSRRTILEAVQESTSGGRAPAEELPRLSPEKKKTGAGVEKKRGRPPSTTAAANDPRQKKICFGRS